MTRFEDDRDRWRAAGIQLPEKKVPESIPLDEIGVPDRVWLANGHLWWEEPQPRDTKMVVPAANALAQFVMLAYGRQSDDDVLRFAKRWGALALCKCGKSYGHSKQRVEATITRGYLFANDASAPATEIDPDDPKAFEGEGRVSIDRLHLETRDEGEFAASVRRQGWVPFAPMTCSGRQPRSNTHPEPIDRWRQIAGQFRALLDIASRLAQGQPARVRDLDKLEEWEPELVERVPGDVELQRRLVTYLVNRWLYDCQVVPVLLWDHQTPYLRLRSLLTPCGRLWGTLTVQLMTALGHSKGIVFCSGCGMAMEPRRRPTTRYAVFCDACKAKKVPNAQAQQRHRDRLRHGPKDAPPLRRKLGAGELLTATKKPRKGIEPK